MGLPRSTVTSVLSFILGTNDASMNMIASKKQPQLEGGGDGAGGATMETVIYIDGNSLIYHKLQDVIPVDATASTLFAEKSVLKIVEQVKDSVIGQLNHIYLENRPFSKIVLVFDGPCPFAKNQEQRKRRFANVSSLMASPGTFFMFKICQEIYKWADDVFYSHATKGVDIKVEFSDCFVPGEGEIKILEAIRNNPNCRHVVYTKDSDFVLLLLTSCEENIILVNDYQKIEKIILVKRVRDQFGLFDNQQYKEKLNSILLDMVFLSISFGNDYLKPMSHEQKLLNLLLRYKKKKQKYPEKSLVHIEKNTIGLDLEFFTKILIKSKDVQPSMKRSEEETLLTLNYLKSLLWCIGTYESGVCRNYSQFSHCTPPVLLSQMIQDMRILAKRDKILMLPTIGDSSLLPVTFLMSIMPFTVSNCRVSESLFKAIKFLPIENN
ncbi:predicted protein [Naegleria gruberi]|uniref:Predicted protein n=1 Tax=Naegleria gruberi TaxID=5762 RepID=D2UYF9_NAEGR|nr:uncharacterized protein NAEGRDRAFT_61457 [Naegleria gruberi]EFC50468.1 predicted protein [Naegleria gruberi]|eukprot:XP_002683212.1 predicted protein [Naegleria gruberi strain NEG-M]